MQSEAYKMTGFTAVISALGFLIRWLQGMRIIDPDTGLATSGMGISVLLTALIIVTAAILAVMVFRLKRFDAPLKAEEALSGKSFLYTAAYIVPGVMLALAGIVLLVHTPEEAAQGEVAALRICGVGALLGAVGVWLTSSGAADPRLAGRRRVGSALIILFGGLWLITTYKTAATDMAVLGGDPGDLRGADGVLLHGGLSFR